MYYDFMVKKKPKSEKPKPFTFKYKHPAGARKQFKKDKSYDINSTPLVPLVQVRINGVILEGLLDSGCTSILIPRKLERIFRLKYTDRSIGNGVSGSFNQLETEVELTIGTGSRAIHIGRIKAFSPEDPKRDNPILIGQTAFEHMRVIFDKKNNNVTLIPNGD